MQMMKLHTFFFHEFLVRTTCASREELFSEQRRTFFRKNSRGECVECFFGTGRGPVDGPAVFLDPCQIDYLGPSLFKKLFKRTFSFSSIKCSP